MAYIYQRESVPNPIAVWHPSTWLQRWCLFAF